MIYPGGEPRPSYFDLGHGVGVQFESDAKPYIQWKHIDGPLLHLRCSTLHWLTLWERFRVWLGLDDAYSLERKHAPPGFVDKWEARVALENPQPRCPVCACVRDYRRALYPCTHPGCPEVKP